MTKMKMGKLPRPRLRARKLSIAGKSSFLGGGPKAFAKPGSGIPMGPSGGQDDSGAAFPMTPGGPAFNSGN